MTDTNRIEEIRRRLNRDTDPRFLRDDIAWLLADNEGLWDELHRRDEELNRLTTDNDRLRAVAAQLADALEEWRRWSFSSDPNEPTPDDAAALDAYRQTQDNASIHKEGAGGASENPRCLWNCGVPVTEDNPDCENHGGGMVWEITHAMPGCPFARCQRFSCHERGHCIELTDAD